MLLVIQCKDCSGWTEFLENREALLAYRGIVCTHCDSDRLDGRSMRSRRTYTGKKEVKARKFKESPVKYKTTRMGNEWF